MSNPEPAPVVDASNRTDGTAVIEFGNQLSDTAGRLPAVLALARHTGGVYAENLAGMGLDAALDAAGLGFTAVKCSPISVPFQGTPIVGLDQQAGVVAHWPTGSGREPALLGVVGTGYPVMQPAATGEFGQMLLDEAGATIAGVCGYGNPRGSRMVIALKLPEGLKIGGEDPHDVYLYVGNSFNTETALWGCIAPIRLACVNQAAATFGRLSNRFAIRHSGDLRAKVDEARLTLKITDTFTQRYRETAEALLATPMDDDEVGEYVAVLLTTPTTVKTARGRDSWDLRRRSLVRTIISGPNNTVGRGTRYAAYHGAVEYADHLTGARSATARATRIVDGGQVERFKTRAAALLTNA